VYTFFCFFFFSGAAAGLATEGSTTVLGILEAVPSGVWLDVAPSAELPWARFLRAVFSEVLRLRFLNSARTMKEVLAIVAFCQPYSVRRRRIDCPDKVSVDFDSRGKNRSQLSPANLGSLASSRLIINSCIPQFQRILR
jgi:hypothetical protein